MQFNITKHKDDLIFLPLGGAGEIGMNFNLYHYQGKWLIVDCGSGFAEEYMPGIDIIIPDISYLVKHRKNILGIVLTHSHEDHIGSVQYLWEVLDCPIYATPFSTAFLKNRLFELGQEHVNKIIELPIQSKTNIGGLFDIEMVPLSHSIPEMHAVVIKTKFGSIFHTGDWKFDSNPIIGDVNDEELLKQYGDEGVLALIGDSTNVFNTGFSGSETELKESLIELISSCKKMVIVTTFASNVGRLEGLMEAAVKTGRKVALSGRSLKRMLKAAQESGYMLDIPEIIDERDIGKHEREKILIISTGCQGEPLAAMTKVANEDHPNIKIRAGDTVIFSSKIIPGNDKKIFRVFNKLVKLGAEILTEKDHFVHVSGHPSKDELIKLYELLRPNTLIPVHGEHIHMHEHAKIGKSLGIPNILEVENGVVVKLAPGRPQKIGVVEAGELGVYGNYFLKPDSEILKMRRKLKNDGVFFATIILDTNRYHLAVDPIIVAPGYLDAEEDKHFIMHIQDMIRLSVEDQIVDRNKKSKLIMEDLQKNIKSKIKSLLKREVNRIPIIHVEIRII